MFFTAFKITWRKEKLRLKLRITALRDVRKKKFMKSAFLT